MIWFARLELGDEFINVEMDAVDKEDALRLVDRQNKRLALLNNRAEYHLVSLVPEHAGKKVSRFRKKGDRNARSSFR